MASDPPTRSFHRKNDQVSWHGSKIDQVKVYVSKIDQLYEDSSWSAFEINKLFWSIFETYTFTWSIVDWRDRTVLFFPTDLSFLLSPFLLFLVSCESIRLLFQDWSAKASCLAGAFRWPSPYWQCAHLTVFFFKVSQFAQTSHFEIVNHLTPSEVEILSHI